MFLVYLKRLQPVFKSNLKHDILRSYYLLPMEHFEFKTGIEQLNKVFLNLYPTLSINFTKNIRF